MVSGRPASHVKLLHAKSVECFLRFLKKATRRYSDSFMMYLLFQLSLVACCPSKDDQGHVALLLFFSESYPFFLAKTPNFHRIIILFGCLNGLILAKHPP